MPDVSIKPLLTAAAPAATTPLSAPSAVSPTNAAVKSDAGQGEGCERAPAETATTFANALQKQLDKSAKPGADSPQGDGAEGPAPTAAPEVTTGALNPTADLTNLLAGLLPNAAPSVATPQAAPDTAEQAAAAAMSTVPPAGSEFRPVPARATLSMGTSLAPDAAASEAKSASLPEAVTATADQHGAAAKPAVIAAFDKPAAESAVRATGDGKPNAGIEPSDIQVGHVDPQGELHAVHSAVTGERATPRLESAPVRVDTPVGAPGWREEVGQRISWLVGRGEQRAELVLTPPHLGRVEVTVTVNNDQANALFVSANPAVREALEQALPRLREVLADAGIALGQANVNAESSRGKQGSEASPRHGNLADSELPGVAAQDAPWVRRGVGLVDTFA
jgi:flagellar hook-length control protein FliK